MYGGGSCGIPLPLVVVQILQLAWPPAVFFEAPELVVPLPDVSLRLHDTCTKRNASVSSDSCVVRGQ